MGAVTPLAIASTSSTSVGAWASCMADAGHDYDNPRQPNEQYAGNGTSPREDAVLAVDLVCKQQANLFAAWFTAKSEHESALAAEHADVVEQFRRMRSIPLPAKTTSPTTT